MRRNLLAAGAAALALGCSVASAAVSTVSASLTYTLTDLNLGDGLAPEIDTPMVRTIVEPIVDGCCGSGGSGPSTGILAFGDFDATYPPYDASASAQGSVLRASASGTGSASIYGSSQVDYYLTPYTSATFTFSASMSATSGFGFAWSQLCINSDIVCQRFNAGAGSQTSSVAWTFTNDTDQGMPFFFEADELAFASGVPEPSTVALMAIGVGLLSLHLRRSRR